MKNFFADFKKFINRGNIFDMAVGVIVGAAFSTIVTVFTDKIIMPLIKMMLMSIGGNGLDSAYTVLHGVYTIDATTGESVLDLTNSIYIDWGAFITAIINFIIIAFTLFVVLRLIMRSREMIKKAEDEVKKVRLTREDKRELKERGISLKDKEAVKLFKTEKIKAIEEKQKEELKKGEKSKLTTEEELLKEIRDLLKDMNKKEI